VIYLGAIETLVYILLQKFNHRDIFRGYRDTSLYPIFNNNYRDIFRGHRDKIIDTLVYIQIYFSDIFRGLYDIIYSQLL